MSSTGATSFFDASPEEFAVRLFGSAGRTRTRPNASLGGRQVFPPDNPWNQDVSGEPVDPRSAGIIGRIGADLPLFPDFGDSFGKPYVVVALCAASMFAWAVT